MMKNKKIKRLLVVAAEAAIAEVCARLLAEWLIKKFDKKNYFTVGEKNNG